MKLSDKKILITGANGFIGLNLVNKLKKYRKNLYALVEPGTSAELIKNIKYKFINITDKENVKKYILKTKPDIIIHLAAHINNDIAIENITNTSRINVGGVLNILDSIASLAKKPFLVFISTGEVYGRIKDVPFTETMLPEPNSIYAIAKFSAEDACEKYSHVYDIPLLIIRPSVVYGQFQKEGMFIPSIIKSLIFDKNFNMTGGKQLRDFIYVEDFLDGLVKLIKTSSRGIFNVSSDRSYVVKNVALKIKKLINTKAVLNIGALPYRENEIWDYKLSNSKIRNQIKWKPKYTLEKGLKKTINWYRKFYAS